MGVEYGCDPKEVAMKSFFLGPQAENGVWFRDTISHILDRWFEWRRTRSAADGAAISQADRSLSEFRAHQESLSRGIETLLSLFEQELPKFSPRYIGHMFSEVSIPGLVGQFVTLLHNPNLVSSEAARIGARIESDAIDALAKMFGFDPEHSFGHFTSGGTIANFEAFFRARERAKGQSKGLPAVLVPASKHYSWQKAVSLFGLPDESFCEIALDIEGRLDVKHLETKLRDLHNKGRPVWMVVSVLGTTEFGELDPVDKVQDVLDQWKKITGIELWHHVDAAYGGFFRTLGDDQKLNLAPAARAALAATSRVTSITVDPHKLGYIPYSCGAFLVRNRSDYFQARFGGPYLDFHREVQRGEFTIEGSRSGGGAVATWLLANSVGLDENGLGRILSRTIEIRKKLEVRLVESLNMVRVAPGGDTNIICFHLAKSGESLAESNARTEKLYETLGPWADGPFYVSKTIIDREAYVQYFDSFVHSWGSKQGGENEVFLIRLCLMNPFIDSKEMRFSLTEKFVEFVCDWVQNYGY